jgi:alginate O-acetyltransferase complex protein AlgI
MLFNSYAFIFGFLPVVWIAFFVIGRYSRAGASGWLALSSLFFYGWWSPSSLPLLIGSICVNYLFGVMLSPRDGSNEQPSRILLVVAIGTNLALLGFFKYSDFFIANANVALAAANIGQMQLLHVLLPIGISFFTFTQIAFLADCWQGKVRERNFVHYTLFVTYFPHLIAGPVLHHAQMMPQFARHEIYRIDWQKMALGMAVFTVGLAKKLLIADPLGDYADSLFAAVDQGLVPTLFVAWCGVLAYAFQIYFDFSGYSDMAVGLSLFFGIHLPANFASPYRATSIIDFWHRWHISLSTFLRDYLYIPLGGNRLGRRRRYINLLITMILGGLWHGANWTFVLWGAAHGLLLIVNHGWRRIMGEPRKMRSPLTVAASWLPTFIAISFTWVLFKADTVATAIAVMRGMLGLNGVSVPDRLIARLQDLPIQLPVIGQGWFQGMFQPNPLNLMIPILFSFSVLFLPNLNAMSARSFVMQRQFLFSKAFVIGALFCLCLIGLLQNKSPQFLYFQF